MAAFDDGDDRISNKVEFVVIDDLFSERTSYTLIPAINLVLVKWTWDIVVIWYNDRVGVICMTNH